MGARVAHLARVFRPWLVPIMGACSLHTMQRTFRMNSDTHNPHTWPSGAPIRSVPEEAEGQWEEETDKQGRVWYVKRPRFCKKRLRIRVANKADGEARMRQLRDLREKLAIGLIDDRQALVAAGVLVRGRLLQVEDVWQPYFDGLSERSQKIAACSWKYHLAPYFEGKRAAELTANVMAEWEKAERAKPGQRPGELLSAKTVRNAYDLLRTAYSRAIEAGEIQRVPWEPSYRPPSIAGHTERVASREACRSIEELQALVREAVYHDEANAKAGRYSDMSTRLLVLALCGLRQGEAAGLGWEDVDLDVEPYMCRVRYQVTDGWRARHPEWTRPLSPPKSRRPGFLLHPVALKVLRHHRERLTERGWYDEKGPVFPTTGGGAEGGGWRSHADLVPPALFRKFVERAGLPNPDRWVTHSLRHTFATLEAAALPSIRDLMLRTGHSSINVAQAYIHSVGRGHVRSGISEAIGEGIPDVGPRPVEGAMVVRELAGPTLEGLPAMTVERGRAIEEGRKAARREKRQAERIAFAKRHGLGGGASDYRALLGAATVAEIRAMLTGRLGPKVNDEKRRAYQAAYVRVVRSEGKEAAALAGRRAQAMWLRHFYDALRANAKVRGVLPPGWTAPVGGAHGTTPADESEEW